MPKTDLHIYLSLALLLCVPTVCAQQQPNIVLIVADDIGYSDFGAYGGEIDTPNIDNLATEGVRFTNFRTASSCAPTRAMLMTGVDSHLAGIGSMRELVPLSHRWKPGYEGVLNNKVETIASKLKSAGYRTSVAGKWHLGTETRNLPPARGFDFSVIQADSGSDNFEMRPYLPMKPEAYWYENGKRISSLPDDFYSSTFFVDKTIHFLESSKTQGKPFFAYVAFQANHTPIQAPALFIDKYRGRYLQGWADVHAARIEKIRELGLIPERAILAAGPTQDDWNTLSQEQQYFEARRMQAYAGMATAMDHEIGRLIAYLKDIKQYDNTVFVVLSDNGAVANEPYENKFGRRWLEENYHREVETLGEKGSWVAAGRYWGQVANTPFKGQKFSASEGGVRVPLIISGLPEIESGALSHEFAYVTDITPTLLEVAGLSQTLTEEGREAISGLSLLTIFDTDSGPTINSREAVGYEFSGNAALYLGEHKLVRNLPPLGDGQWRLFNMKNDPGETTDLSKQMPKLYQNMLREYRSYTERTGVLPMPDNYTVSKQVAINAALFAYGPRYSPYIAGVILAVAFLLRRVLRKNPKPG